MSVTGPGCEACEFRGWVARGYSSEAFPCDRCGGLGVFARVACEDDWRPCPSIAEVRAHNARDPGACFGWWLCDDEPDNPAGALRAVQLDVGLAFGGSHDEVYGLGDGVTESTRNPAARFRPITRRGAALPWPEVPR